jgi:heme-degrading monooxygenase HmoA
MSTTR